MKTIRYMNFRKINELADAYLWPPSPQSGPSERIDYDVHF